MTATRRIYIMKKSKFLKTVAAIAVGVVAAAGAISLAACGGGDPEPTPGPGPGPGPSGGDPVAHTYTYSWTELTTAAGYDTGETQTETDKLALTQANFTGNNAFITVVDASTLTWRNYKQAKGAFEMKGEGVSVTFQGTGTITISFCSTGGSNTSGFALVKPDGTWLEATSTTATKVAADETIADGYVNKAGLYTITGTTAGTVTYTIETAGTYKFYSSYSYLDSGVGKSRGCRISGISMTDNY